MVYKPGVILGEEPAFISYYGDGVEVSVLRIKCPKCGMEYRLPMTKKRGVYTIPKRCPYCGKKLVKGGKTKYVH